MNFSEFMEKRKQEPWNTTEHIIEEAKKKYPLSVQYRGKLFAFDIEELEKECEIHCSSVYMDGSGMYHIRYKMK